jgi:hypothetical protein
MTKIARVEPIFIGGSVGISTDNGSRWSVINGEEPIGVYTDPTTAEWIAGKLNEYNRRQQTEIVVAVPEPLEELDVPDGQLKTQDPSIQKKAFGNIKNYLHNTLGLTKSYVDTMIKDHVAKTCKSIVTDELGTSKNGWFKELVRQTIVTQIGAEVKKASDFSRFIEDLCREEIKKHVLSRMKVDLRVTTIKPEEGVDREVISPGDPFRGVREP